MSTKIYNGYTLGNMTLMELHQFTQTLRAKMNDLYKEMYSKLVAKKTVDLIDSLFLKPIKKVEEEYNEEFPIRFRTDASIEALLYRGVRNKVEDTKKSMLRDFEYDLHASIVFIPLPDKLLALFYAEKKEYVRLFESLPEVKEYGYWNNEDCPDEISEEEWDQRQKDWKIALPGVGIPSENGFVVEFFTNLPIITSTQSIPYMPSFKNRVKYLARMKVLNNKIIKIREQQPEESGYFSIYDQANQWLETEEGQKVFKEIEGQISQQIPMDITKELLTANIDEIISNKEKFL